MIKRLLILMLTGVTFVSCEYKDLCYDHDHSKDENLQLVLDLKLDLELELMQDLDVDIDIQTKIDVPEYMSANFYFPDNGAFKSKDFVRAYGGPLSTAPGAYDMVVYTFGTEYVKIRGEGNINTLEAYTSDITSAKRSTLRALTRGSTDEDEPQGPIIYAPDHLLVARDHVTIPEWYGTNKLIRIYAQAATIVETYGFEVHSVIGAEYIASCEAYVTNQARSSFFGRGEVNTEPATICFPVGVDKKKGCLYTTFNTFGKLPGDSHSYLHILIRDVGGKEYHISTDITDQFEKKDHHILIEEPVEIPKPEAAEGGGLAPSVEQWQEEIHDVGIG